MDTGVYSKIASIIAANRARERNLAKTAQASTAAAGRVPVCNASIKVAELIAAKRLEKCAGVSPEVASALVAAYSAGVADARS